MAYNLYQVQMANAWSERVGKEASSAENWWGKYRHMVSGELPPMPTGPAAERYTLNSSLEPVRPDNSLPLPGMEEEKIANVLASLESQVAAEKARRDAMQGDIDRLTALVNGTS